jgi:hypothetical protein
LGMKELSMEEKLNINSKIQPPSRNSSNIYNFYQKLSNTQTPINIIFLDIDGVLVKVKRGALDNEKAYTEKSQYVEEKLGSKLTSLSIYDIGATLLFSPNAINNLRALCKNHEAKIVITSQWRIKNDREQSMEKLTSLFKLWDLENFILDVTPYSLISRSEEIQQWLNETKYAIGSFVILDDEDRGLSQKFGERFICTKDSMLFLKKHYDQAAYVLKKNFESNYVLPQ